MAANGKFEPAGFRAARTIVSRELSSLSTAKLPQSSHAAKIALKPKSNVKLGARKHGGAKKALQAS